MFKLKRTKLSLNHFPTILRLFKMGIFFGEKNIHRIILGNGVVLSGYLLLEGMIHVCNEKKTILHLHVEVEALVYSRSVWESNIGSVFSGFSRPSQVHHNNTTLFPNTRNELIIVQKYLNIKIILFELFMRKSYRFVGIYFGRLG